MQHISLFYNKKIYVCVLGMFLATIIYNLIDMDFSFYDIDYNLNAFGKLCIIYLIQDFKIWLFIYLIYKLKFKKITEILFLIWLGYLFASIFIVSILHSHINILGRAIFCICTYLYIYFLYHKEHKRKYVFIYLLLFAINIFFQVFLKIIF